MANTWFRLYAEFAYDPKIQSMDETLQRRFIMLLCLQCNNELEKLTENELSFALHIDENELQKTKEVFIKKGFIDDCWTVLKWDKRQYKSDNSTERSRRWREKNKEQESGNDDATLQKRPNVVTATPPDTDTDTDTKLHSAFKNAVDGVDFLLTKRKRKLNGQRWEAFKLFWDAFGYKKGKREAADAWLDIPQITNSLLDEILSGAKKECQRRPKLIADGRTPKMAQGWISSSRWEDEDYTPPEKVTKWIKIS